MPKLDELVEALTLYRALSPEKQVIAMDELKRLVAESAASAQASDSRAVRRSAAASQAVAS